MGKVTATVVMNVEMTDEQMDKLFLDVLKTKREKFLQTKLSLFGEDAKGSIEVDMGHRQFLLHTHSLSLARSVSDTVDKQGYDVAKADMTDEDYHLLRAFDVLERL